MRHLHRVETDRYNRESDNASDKLPLIIMDLHIHVKSFQSFSDMIFGQRSLVLLIGNQISNGDQLKGYIRDTALLRLGQHISGDYFFNRLEGEEILASCLKNCGRAHYWTLPQFL